MSLWKRLFGGAKEPAPVPQAPAPVQPRPAAVDLSQAGQLLDCVGIEWNGEAQLAFVRNEIGNLVGRRLATLLCAENFKGNSWCSPIDAAVLFAIQARHEPTRQMEIGSGYTTLVFNHAKRILNLPGELITVDPEPRCDVGEFVDAQLIMPISEVPTDDFRLLTAGEMAFFDLPHTTAGLDDVYTRIIPALAPGVIVGLHGVRLPRHYTREELQAGMCEHDRILSLLKSGRAEVLFSGGWLAENHPGLLASSLEGTFEGESTALWIRIIGS